jgi:hypothetical protein
VITTGPSCRAVLGSVVHKAGEVRACPSGPAAEGATRRFKATLRPRPVKITSRSHQVARGSAERRGSGCGSTAHVGRTKGFGVGTTNI